MKTKNLLICLLLFCSKSILAQEPPTETIHTAAHPAKEEQAVINISKQKWDWMADKNIVALNNLFDSKSMFIHMGGTWGKATELKTIRDGGILYKKAAVYAVVVNMLGNTAILLNDIDLVAVVGGKEVVNPFMVTEVYVKQKGTWKLGSLTFSHLRRAVKLVTADADKQVQ